MTHSDSHGGTGSLNYAGHNVANPGGTSAAQVGGLLGIAGNFIGLAIFVAGCFGLGASFLFSPLPLLLGAVGLLITFFGGLFLRAKAEDTHVVAAIFINVFAIVGGLLELAVWMKWTIIVRGA